MTAPTPKQELSFNLADTKEFLRLLDRAATSFTFQTFD
jgi:hypothetical protein